MTEDITKKLTNLEETNKQIKDIGWQLEGLESILKNPKQRGILWEYFLESVLKNILPPENYKLQYGFKNWEVVDAAIFIKEKVIPIDSKFSLENYNKILDSKTKEEKEIYEKEFRNDLKKRIDETSKYIRPEENTMEFAFMFIPSEWIYYDLLVNKVGTLKVNTTDLVEYAFKERKVIIVSPTSFYAYLQTVMQWLRALQIEEAAKDIQKQVEKLWKHLNSYEEYIHKLWGTLGTTVSHYNNAYKEFGKIDKDVIKITNAAQWGKVEVLQLEKPWDT
jgi:DNA recombination protein RmuC